MRKNEELNRAKLKVSENLGIDEDLDMIPTWDKPNIDETSSKRAKGKPYKLGKGKGNQKPSKYNSVQSVVKQNMSQP